MVDVGRSGFACYTHAVRLFDTHLALRTWMWFKLRLVLEVYCMIAD